MAKITHCGIESRATVYRLPSQKAVYEYQIAYHCKKCKGCGKELMFWKGEYPEGKSTDLIAIPKQEFAHWQRRIDAGEAKPEMQRASEYSMNISRPPEIVIDYLHKLDNAQCWWKGQRIAR